LNKGWLTLSILLLWLGWLGFNPGSTLSISHGSEVVVLTTLLASASSFLSVMFFRYVIVKQSPDLLYAVNGILMGLIVITPIAGFVSPGSAVILGLLGGPLFLVGERWFSRFKWFSDPVGLFPGHMVGGAFGIMMIPFFTQSAFAAVSGFSSLPDGLLFGGGLAAIKQFGIEAFGIVVVMVTVFVLTSVTVWIIGKVDNGITTNYGKEVREQH
jgi:Amt family ammonium transporter